MSKPELPSDFASNDLLVVPVERSSPDIGETTKRSRLDGSTARLLPGGRLPELDFVAIGIDDPAKLALL